jgi:hypothetical protein
MVTYETLPCGTIVFRAILNKDWVIGDKSVHWLAFQLREEDKGKVSLLMTTQASEEHFSKPTYGNISVHVGRLRDIVIEGEKLGIEQDQETHASIIGLPNFWLEEDTKKRKILKNKVKNFCEDISEKASRIYELSELYFKK